MKIRHYGLLASGNAKTKLPIARRLLELQSRKANATAVTASVPPSDWRELFKAVTGIDLLVCPRCRQGKMIPHPLYPSEEPPDTS